MGNNPWACQRADVCPQCKKIFPKGTKTYGHKFDGDQEQKWYCPKCAEYLGLVCPKCETKKNPDQSFCWNCMNPKKNNEKIVSYDNEYEKEVAELMKEKIVEEKKEEPQVKITCTSVYCPERIGKECNAPERVIKREELEKSINAVWNEFRDKLFNIIRSI